MTDERELPFPSDEDVLRAQEALQRNRATCRVAVKRIPRGRWETIARTERFGDAIRVATTITECPEEIAVFVEHDVYGGIMLWSSLSSVVNTLTWWKEA